MCLALPARVIEISDGNAIVDLDGVRMTISLALLDDVAVGDYVVTHVGFALTRIDPAEAARTLELVAAAKDAQAKAVSP